MTEDKASKIDMNKLVEGLAHDEQNAHILLAILISSFQELDRVQLLRKYGMVCYDSIKLYSKEISKEI